MKPYRVTCSATRPAPGGISRALLPLAVALALCTQALAHERDWHQDRTYPSAHSGVDHAHDRHHQPHDREPYHASDAHRAGYWQGVVNAALTFGGERLATVEVDTRFSGVESEDIRAGELMMFGGGLLYTEGNFQLQGIMNYHVDGIFGDNGDASFTRWPLELMAFTTTPRWRVGGGISYHIDPELEIDIDFQPRQRVNFKNETGIVFQADYRLNDQVSIGLRHMAIEYEAENGSDAKIDGDNTGVIFTASF
ncbi:MAG: hypothetical protein EX270_02425 [Pseudomonadales bacterium]|nr:MAG: hypothetical protein EX270_02425 [Pseudomonadales bacterium]